MRAQTIAAATRERPAARHRKGVLPMFFKYTAEPPPRQGQRGPKPISPDARFWRNVHALDNGCWEWMAACRPDGYGVFMDGSQRMARAHRWAYKRLIGPFSSGLQSDHLCRNR